MSTAPPAAPPLGNLIRLARRDRGLSQTLLGNEIGVAQSIISAWENGKARPNAAYLLKLAHILNVDRTAFFDAIDVEETAAP